jgi:hypothetical protein
MMTAPDTAKENASIAGVYVCLYASAATISLPS